jgi:glycosyltransferase involved in cell wall biosynthesis
VLTEERAEKIDEIVVLSEWQRARFADLYPFAEDKLRVVRNGISLIEMNDAAESRFPHAAKPFSKRKPRAVYSSSADRGLDILLELWPRVRERVPTAELHVFYGWNVFDAVARLNPALAAYKQKVLDLYEAAGGEDGGVFMRGRVGQRELADEMQQARVWAYPTAFLETSCIGAMEARAAGMALVTSDLAALHETVGTAGMLLPWDGPEDGEPGWEPHNTTVEYQQAFVEAVSRLLADAEQWGFWHRAALKDVDGLDWERRVDEWEALVAARARHLVAV